MRKCLEFSRVVYDANASDADGTAANNTITYTLSTDGDNDLYDIDLTTGHVTFKVSPNYEAPADANADNAYQITVHAIDNNGVHDVTQAVTVTVTDVNDNARSEERRVGKEWRSRRSPYHLE